MSEFGSIKNAGKLESAGNLNNKSLVKFGVILPAEIGPTKFDQKIESNTQN